MKGVVLAGGTGSRLFPLTKVTNKHLLPVGRYPMIYHPVSKLAEVGIREILIITGTEHMGTVVGTLGSGHHLGLEFTYRVQDEAGGIAQALGLAEKFAGGDRSVVILGDNIFEDSIGPYLSRFLRQPSGARILLKEVADPGRFGVPEISGGRILSLEEKPKAPKSSYAVTGIYMFDHTVFEAIRPLTPSKRGELEIIDVLNSYLVRNDLEYDVLSGWWTDAGTFPSLALANMLAAKVVLPLVEESKGHRVGATGDELAIGRFQDDA